MVRSSYSGHYFESIPEEATPGKSSSTNGTPSKFDPETGEKKTMVLNYFEMGDDTEANFSGSQLVTNGMIQQVLTPDPAR